MPASAAGLIHTDRMNGGHIHAGTSGFDIMINDPPQALVGFPYQARRRPHGHRPYQGHDQRFEEQGKMRAFPRPGDRYLMHHMLRAHHTGHTGVEIGLMLEEIHMSPRLFLNIMHRTFRAADRTREAASLGEVDVQIQPLLFDFEGHVIHHPRRNQTQGQG